MSKPNLLYYFPRKEEIHRRLIGQLLQTSGLPALRRAVHTHKLHKDVRFLGYQPDEEIDEGRGDARGEPVARGRTDHEDLHGAPPAVTVASVHPPW